MTVNVSWLPTVGRTALFALVLSSAMRRDAREVDGFTPDDKRWLRARDRRSGRIKVGKFNAGQKLNASLVSGAVLVMILSGSVMIDLLGIWPLRARTGATFISPSRARTCAVRPG